MIREETYSPQKHEWGTKASVRWAKKITPNEGKKVKRFKEFREAMNPQMKKAVKTIAKPKGGKYGASNYDHAVDKGGSDYSMGGTPKQKQADAAKKVRKAKKVIKRYGGQSTYDRVKKNAEKGFVRRNAF